MEHFLVLERFAARDGHRWQRESCLSLLQSVEISLPLEKRKFCSGDFKVFTFAVTEASVPGRFRRITLSACMAVL
ncbi:MAG: hypothetical protein Fues2KO_11720 [Fuerstiella sp.]